MHAGLNVKQIRLTDLSWMHCIHTHTSAGTVTNGGKNEIGTGMSEAGDGLQASWDEKGGGGRGRQGPGVDLTGGIYSPRLIDPEEV